MPSRPDSYSRFGPEISEFLIETAICGVSNFRKLPPDGGRRAGRGGWLSGCGLPGRSGWDRLVRDVPGRVRLAVRRADARASTGECAVDRARDVLDGRYAGGLIRVPAREDHDGVVPGSVGGGERPRAVDIPGRVVVGQRRPAVLDVEREGARRTGGHAPT